MSLRKGAFEIARMKQHFFKIVIDFWVYNCKGMAIYNATTEEDHLKPDLFFKWKKKNFQAPQKG
jgi:hypothetical protein